LAHAIVILSTVSNADIVPAQDNKF